MATTVTAPQTDDLDAFVKAYQSKAAPPVSSKGTDDDLDSFVRDFRAKAASPVSPKDTSDDLDTFAQNFKAASAPALSKIPITSPSQGPQPFPQPVQTGLEMAQKYLVDPFEKGVGALSQEGSKMGEEAFAMVRHPSTAPTPEAVAQSTAQSPVGAGISRAAGGLAIGAAADPRNWPFLGSGALKPIFQRLISAGFATQMGRGAYQQVKQLIQNWDTLTPAQRSEGIASSGLGTLMAGFAAKGTVGAGENLAPETAATLKAQTDALENGTNRAVFFPRGQQDIPEPPENATVTVVKGNRPGSGTWYHGDEVTPQEIRAAVKDGSYPELLGYTQPKEQAVAAGKPATVVARHADGTELKAGLVDSSDPQAVAEQAAEFARQFPDAKIGIESPESVIAARQAPIPKPETPATETPLSPQTQQVKAKPQPLAERFSPETLDEARQELSNAHQLASSFDQPGRYFASIGQTEEMIPQRSQSSAKGVQAGGTWYGVSSSRHIVADQFPWYGEIEQGPTRIGKLIEKGSGAEYERLLGTVAESIEREKATAAPILAEFSPRLRELSDNIDGHDQDLSNSLAQLANSDGRGFRNLRQYVEGKITDAEEANKFYRLIDTAAAEARQAGTAQSPESRSGLRATESGRASAGAEAPIARGAEGTGYPAPSETSEAPPGTEAAQGLEQNALPGFESAIAEQKRGAMRVQGERLTEEANRPLGDVESAAGEMERTSPLFRNSEANPQSDLFRSKPLESTAPAVGDRVQVTAGPLKGKEVEVTRATDKGGVYVRTDENSRVRYVKAGDFEANDLDAFVRNYHQGKPSFETKALDDLLAPNEKETPGTRYSGLSPAALKKLLPESVREKLDTEVEANQRARGLQGKLYDLESQNAADLIRARNVLKEAPGTPADMEAVYHHLEDPDVKLSSEQRKILDGYLRPMLEKSERINEKLEGGQVENYVHRIPVGKGSLLDRIMGDEGKLSAGHGLSKSSGSLKGRTMMALEDEAGDRRVVSIKGGKVTAFDDGQAEGLGRIRGLETQGVKSSGVVLDRQLEPMQRELDRLETERRTLTATKGREASASRRIENIDNRAAELREGLQDAYRTDEGHLLSENDLRGRVFVDRNGKQWKITQATTKEIEANTGVRYYKNALASTVLNYLQLRRAERAYDFLESYKRSPEFQEVAAKMNGRSVPAGWRPTELPQFHGYAFEPHTAEVLDWYAKRMRAEGPNLYRQIGNFLRTAIFFNPLIHTPNIGVHWIVEKGLTGFGPQNWGRILRTGSRAIDAVIHQNGDFLSALDAGAPLQSARLDNGATTKLFLERMGRELEANPTAAQKVASALGYANPAKLIRAIYNFSSKVTWTSNDIAMLQATYEHMEKTGSSFKEAVTDVSKHIPDYRLPTRIFNSTALAKLMSSPDLTMFGAYHYGALKSYGEMAKGLLSEDMPQSERTKALDRMAMLGLFTFVAYPALDQLAKYLTGDKSAQFRRAGASTFIYNLAQLAQGEKSPTQVLEAVATPAVHTKALLQLAVNRDFFTGRRIVDWNADAETIGKQLARYGGQQLAPVSQGMQVAEGRRTLGQQVAGLTGIKTKVPTPAEALARKFAAESAGTAAPDQDTLERSYLRKQYESDLRDKKITLKDLGHALTAGTITQQDAKTILQRAAHTPLQNEFKGLPIDKALRVWQKADDQERQSLRALLIAKVQRVNLAKYNPAQLKDLISGVRNALTGSVPTTPPSRPWSAIPVIPPNRAAGSIPFRPPSSAGAHP